MPKARLGISEAGVGRGNGPGVKAEQSVLIVSVPLKWKGHQVRGREETVLTFGSKERAQNGNLGEGQVNGPGKEAGVPFAADSPCE